MLASSERDVVAEVIGRRALPLLALLRAALSGFRALAQQRHVLRHDLHGRALAAVPRVVGPYAQLAGHANRRALVQVQLAQRLGALAEYLHANPVGSLVSP